MSKKFKLVLVVCVLLVSSVLWHYSLLIYLIGQGLGQFQVLWHAEPIDEILADSSYDETLRLKILLIQDVKAFAKERYDMDGAELYRTMFNQYGKDILWNVTACEPFNMQSYTWRFPMLGEVSYKGYFDYSKAETESNRLSSLGYDTRIRAVNAWSTLGWFNDPILSNVLKRSEGRLAELIIHEITHQYVYFSDSTTFNENFASFIGTQGAREYLIARFGIESLEYNTYEDLEADADLLIQYSLDAVQTLDSLYSSFDDQLLDSDKHRLKKEALDQWVEGLSDLPFKKMSNIQQRFQSNPPNNAYFMAFSRYSSKQEELKAQFESMHGGDLKTMIDYYRN